ncbi:MAG TPA: tetratricopeptide repeat protein, partial [Ignavibacteria bacterium]|nr:tetratricopeptide repeat protein [Ignavibacteria bacterium]
MQYKFIFGWRKYVLISFSVLMLSGCSVWGNFTTYFNLYYNANDLFEKAEKDIQNKKQSLFSNKMKYIPGNARQLLVKVIEKGSKILQFHKHSSYVDDALLMLGKAFYYQENYQKSLIKFHELLSTQPNTNLTLETNLWIGKVQIQLREFDKGLSTLDAVRAEAVKKGDKKIFRDAFITEIKYHIIQKDYSGAINLANEFLKVSNDDRINAEVEYEVGKLYQAEGDIPNAIISFRKVQDYYPSYDIKVNSLVQLGSELRDAGRSDTALVIFNNMKDEAKYSDYYYEIDLQRGLTELKLKHYADAIRLLKMVDTTYASKPSSGIARFELAKIYEYHFKNFDSAAYYYSRTVSSTAQY